jgi:hypothetical protein
MVQIHLGVIDIPYIQGETPSKQKARVGRAKAGRTRKSSSSGEMKTTGQVADLLEEEYHVMEVFYNAHEQEIADLVASAYLGTLEDMAMGAPTPTAPLAGATSEIDAMFKKALETQEFDRLIPGVPTQASLMGINHRLKSGRGPGPRPSFIDTGLYETSFRSWASGEIEADDASG